MASSNDSALIELAYAASFVALMGKTGLGWDKPVGDLLPADIERDCYRLAVQFGLAPMGVDAEDLSVIQSTWRRQLRHERQREMLDMGNLLVRQHALITFLQSYPSTPHRPEMCFQLDWIRQSLTRFFTRYRLKNSLEKLPDLPLPTSPDTWMSWSGDALRNSVLQELREKPE